MDQTIFIQKKNLCKVVVLGVSINVWSKCDDANIHMTFVVCVSIAKYDVTPLLILPGKWFDRYFLECCYIEDDKITTALNFFINYTLFLIWIEFFYDSIPDSVAFSRVLVYDGCCSHYNDNIVKKHLSLKSYWLYFHIIPSI